MMGFDETYKIIESGFAEETVAGDDCKERFRMMEDVYTEWNAKINVISRKDIGNLYGHHVLHSLAIARYLRTEDQAVFKIWSEGTRVMDIGTGGGFPGIPLAVLFPETEFTLCDSIRKKTVVAQAAADSLHLDNVKVLNARAEDVKGKWDYIVTRAVAPLADLYSFSKGLAPKRLLCLKGGDVDREILHLQDRYPGKVATVRKWKVDSWLEADYYRDKLVVDVSLV